MMQTYKDTEAYFWYLNEDGDSKRRPGLPAIQVKDERAVVVAGEVYCRFYDDSGTQCPNKKKWSERTLKTHLRTAHGLNIADRVHNSQKFWVDQSIGGFYATMKNQATGEVNNKFTIPLDAFGSRDILKMKQNAGIGQEDRCDGCQA